MMDLAGIPLRSRDRGEDDPLIVAGGPVVFNVEPLADFVDLDGPLLLKNDRAFGMTFDNGVVGPPTTALWG